MRFKDHPRRCGENHHAWAAGHIALGSPPQVRGKPELSRPRRRKGRITPAGAGKTADSPPNPQPCAGSPPQVRGKLRRHDNFGFCARITPAGAGKTNSVVRLAGLDRDHPRRCGENMSDTELLAKALGSPPQVRGKHTNAFTARISTRITPAGAGKTTHGMSVEWGCWDHPRRCGENRSKVQDVICGTGSPPQVRGKLCTAGAQSASPRITPAGAGKTHRHNVAQCIIWDHPRRCGENFVFVLPQRQREGSPPQVRGKRILAETAEEKARDHPRRCGENSRVGKKDSRQLGSPPQVRGKPALNARYAGTVGITPAGAGKTRHQADHDKRPEDHPRRCGENLA